VPNLCECGNIRDDWGKFCQECRKRKQAEAQKTCACGNPCGRTGRCRSCGIKAALQAKEKTRRKRSHKPTENQRMAPPAASRLDRAPEPVASKPADEVVRLSREAHFSYDVDPAKDRFIESILARRQTAASTSTDN
jgi:hypothetical protein